MLPWGLSGSLQVGKLWPRSRAEGRSRGSFRRLRDLGHWKVAPHAHCCARGPNLFPWSQDLMLPENSH